MALLLERRGDTFDISDAWRLKSPSPLTKKIMVLLLERRGDEVKVTDEVVKVTAWQKKQSSFC